MGRHAAADGDSVHPVVAAAMARRAADIAGAHRGEITQRIESGLGWPGEPPAPGRGLGWPGDLAPEKSTASPAGETDPSAEPDEEQDEDPPSRVEPGGRRRGWRRLLGLDRAA